MNTTPGTRNAAQTAQEMETGPWSPMRQALFRWVWIAAVASNIATWLHDVGAAWLMTTLAPSPLMVSLVQAATSLPFFVLAIPAGALADIVDRRRLLLLTQLWMLLTAAGLAFLTFADLTTPWLLLLMTVALGCGAALNAPAWQAIVPELVPKEDLSKAIAINSIGINISRAVGPALGGLIVAAAGPAAAFGLNALSFIGVIAVLYGWKRDKPPKTLPPEHLLGAMRAGWRYALRSREFHQVMGRTLVFIFPASALWALLPLLARQELGLAAAGYGALLGTVGAGALIGAYVLPALRRRYSVDLITGVAAAAYGIALLTTAWGRFIPLLALAMLVCGASWITMLSSINVAVQSIAAGWVRGRALSFYLIVFFGSTAVGSIAWGAVAGALGMSATIGIAAVAVILGVGANLRLSLQAVQDIDPTPSHHWPEPGFHVPQDRDQAPAMITVEYNIDAACKSDFLDAMRKLRLSRLRDGAIQWHLFSDPEIPDRYIEMFIAASWLEHLRQHERVTQSDRALQDTLRGYLRETAVPVVSHFIAEKV